jgi:hypothetical protein
MEPITAFLYAMQAAGLVVSAYSANSQQKIIKMGRELEQNQFETNLEAIRLEAAGQSNNELMALRKNIGSQVVMDAAKGNRAGASAWGATEARSSFENDERKRRLNLLAKESQLRAGNVMAGFDLLRSETQLGQSLTKDVLNTIPVTSLLNDSTKKDKPKSDSSPLTGDYSWLK